MKQIMTKLVMKIMILLIGKEITKQLLSKEKRSFVLDKQRG
jgi:hypothetical protein